MSWPEHRDELSRKCLETLEMFVQKHADGEIDDDALRLVADVLTEATAGLTTTDVRDIIYAVSQQFRPKHKRQRRPTAAELKAEQTKAADLIYAKMTDYFQS